MHQHLGGWISSVKIHRPYQRLECICQDRWSRRSTRASLAFSQPQQGREAELDCQLVKRFLLDQIGTNTREVTFRQTGELYIQKMCYRQVQHRVTQKFEALVVVGRKAAMRERELQQPRVGKGVLETRLQRRKASVRFERRYVRRGLVLRFQRD